jgi:hypothetical protein
MISQANLAIDGTTQIRTQFKMVLIGQPKPKTILEKGDIHTNGDKKTQSLVSEIK